MAALPESLHTCDLKPREIVEQLDAHIIGQRDAKRAIAVALRNRWRRRRAPEELRDELHPKNMLMVGPTGCGKTEIARRVAKLTNAPFVKVECTKFTEVGFVGRDVDSIIDDLFRAAVNSEKQAVRAQCKDQVHALARETILMALTGSQKAKGDFEQQFDNGELDDTLVEIEFAEKQQGNGGPKQVPGTVQFFRGGGGGGTKLRRMPVKDAVKALEEIEMEKLIDTEEVHRRAVIACEQDGIVVIDEIDKVVVPADGMRGASGASDEGVQQDLLPLIEGTTVSTKYGGDIKTDHILFIASGAFHSAKPSDMIAELQGRLPIRVELQPLTQDDFYSILTRPKTNLLAQNKELMLTEKVNLEVTDCAIRAIAETAFRANSSTQNIGARRLHSVVERVVEELSFDANEMAGQTISIDAAYVNGKVSDILESQDLHRYLI